MTCVIGYSDPTGIWMGADSASIYRNSGHKTLRADAKVFRNGPMTIGFCGSFRMGQLLHYGLAIPEQPAGMDDMEFLATLFVDEVRTCFRQGGFLTKEDDGETGGDFMIAYKDGLYQIGADFQVEVSTRTYVVLGVGADVAAGAMSVLADEPWIPADAIKRALKAAAQWNAFVAPPFVVVKHKP
jgi:hypothetical protein